MNADQHVWEGTLSGGLHSLTEGSGPSIRALPFVQYGYPFGSASVQPKVQVSVQGNPM
jgi:hypothetical protein